MTPFELRTSSLRCRDESQFQPRCEDDRIHWTFPLQNCVFPHNLVGRFIILWWQLIPVSGELLIRASLTGERIQAIISGPGVLRPCTAPAGKCRADNGFDALFAALL